MHAGYAPHHRPIFDLDVARQGRQAGYDNVVAENTVVSDVGLRHDEVVRSDFRATAHCRAAVDDGQLTNIAFVADGEVARPALIARVLGGATQLSTVADAAPGADGGTRFNNNVGTNHGIGADSDARLDDTEGANDGVSSAKLALGSTIARGSIGIIEPLLWRRACRRETPVVGLVPPVLRLHRPGPSTRQSEPCRP